MNADRVATALLVDDDPDSQQANRQRLEQDGYTVVLARDGNEGLAGAKQMLPNAIFLHLSRGPGNIPFMQALRREDSCRHIRVMVLTSPPRVDPSRKPLRAVPRDAW